MTQFIKGFVFKGFFYLLTCLFYIPLYAADMVLFNGEIYTADDFQPSAGGMAVENGKIIFIGSSEETKKLITSETRVFDLEGKMILPGFIDTHNHVFEGASEAGGGCLLSRDKHLTELKNELNHCKRSITKPGEWVIGYGHVLDSLWGESEALNPRMLLDEIFPENPVVIMEESSHSMLVNSLALELVEISSDSPHPQGGRIMHDQSGIPNGVLFDNAGDIVMEYAWNNLSNQFQISYDGLLAGLEEAASFGITTIGDGRLYWQRGWYEVWQQALQDNQISARVSLRPWIYPEMDIEDQLKFLEEVAAADKAELLIVDQVKMYIDGVLHFGTAKVLEPYAWSWQENLPYGLNYIKPDELPGIFKQLDHIGFGAHIHAIGDAGVRETLDAIESMRESGVGRTYSMTHLEMIDARDINRFVELNVHADFQAGAEYFSDTRWAEFYIGSIRAKKMLPMREVFDTGANVTFSSDWTVNDINPFVAIANSFRLSSSKGLPNIHSAIKASTINGAKALGLDSVTGSLVTGKSADFVVVDRNIINTSADSIEQAEILLTVLQGKTVYEIEEN